MRNILFVLFALIVLTSCSHSYYIVRHAEKAVPSPGNTMSSPNNPPLSEAGEQRAIQLREQLSNKKIELIYSTHTIRTEATAEPLRQLKNLTITNYGPFPDSAFINKLKGLNKNVLIVGHSNTVDDIVNGLTGRRSVDGDLADSEYDNLFVVTYNAKGKFKKYSRKKFGKNSQE